MDMLKPGELDQLQEILQQPEQLLEQILEQKIEGILSQRIAAQTAPPTPVTPAPAPIAVAPPQPAPLVEEKLPEKKILAKKPPRVKPPEKEGDIDSMLPLIPVKGSITSNKVMLTLGLRKKTANKWIKELRKQGMLRLKKDYIFFGTSRLFATKWLLKRREEERLKKEILEKKKIFKVVLTPVDSLLNIVRREKQMSVSDLSRILGLDKGVIEKWASKMGDLVLLEYPANILKSPVVRIKKEHPDLEAPEEMATESMESYQIIADKVPAMVKIYRSSEESMPHYMIDLPYIGEGTSAILDSIRDKLTDRVQVHAEDISDPKKMRELKDRFFKETKNLLLEELTTSEENMDIITGIILHKAYGLGNIELLMQDDWLEEVCVNTSHIPLTAYHKKYGWMKTNLLVENEKAVYNYSSQIGRKVGRNITNLNPIMDAHLLTGDRVCASLFPISSFGNTITIRKFARSPWTITNFISPDHYTLSKEIAAFLWLCFQYELNVIVGGGTASGKTSVLNCLCSLIQPTHRIVSIEDTREINLPSYLYWNWIPLTTREVNPEGKGEVSMLDLIVTSLRMRPDRIIVGEIRRRREAEVLFEAMHTGHSVYSTIHADTARNLQRRLLEPPIELPSAEVEALQLIVIQHRDRTTGTRKTFEIAEIVPGSEKSGFELNYLFRWNSRTKEFIKINESSRIFDDLMLHTGLNKPEIQEDLKEREIVLQWMLDNNVTHIEDVGSVMDMYYKDRDGLLNEIRKKMGM
ncbi:MAG: type II/IV secretion system ATPase subunit [Candidatus Altiarchaeota archaeon]|nr:type II/IV secretion system ATPase subunit [Candidatus Altiarchaeota archaeon]